MMIESFIALGGIVALFTGVWLHRRRERNAARRWLRDLLRKNINLLIKYLIDAEDEESEMLLRTALQEGILIYRQA